MSDGIRLDKWLWAARFYKTRSLARAAVQGGKVQLNGSRCKPGRELSTGDLLQIQRGHETWVVRVEILSGQRGPATVAQTLYSETTESQQRREAEAAQRALERSQRAQRERRPDKRERRQIIRFQRDKNSDY